MKILLLGFGKIAYMPYMNIYLDSLRNKEDVQVDLIYWDRDGKKDLEVPDIIQNSYKFESHLEEQLPFKKKLRHFFRYRLFALKILKKNRYDKIIVLHTTPGLTVFDYLITRYRNKFILDFRDVSYEYIWIYRKIVATLVKASKITFISSDAYRKFLPKSNKIHIIHNFLYDSIRKEGIRNRYPRETKVIRITYWGLVRQVEINKRFLDCIGNDKRFIVNYYGRMQQDGRELEAHAKTKDYNNVFFHGQYLPEDRYAFAENTDLIHNVYDTDQTTGNAMGNKYYDGIIFKIPQLFTLGTYMGKRAIKNHVGYCIDFSEDNVADSIYDYYVKINWDEFSNNCKNELNMILVQQNKAKELIEHFLNN